VNDVIYFRNTFESMIPMLGKSSTIKSSFAKFYNNIAKLNTEDNIIFYFKCIEPLLAIKDQYQLSRFELLLGIPQLVDIEQKYFSAFKLYDQYNNKESVQIFFRSSISQTCILEEIADNITNFEKYFRNPMICTLVYKLLKAALKNDELLKYIRLMPNKMLKYPE